MELPIEDLFYVPRSSQTLFVILAIALIEVAVIIIITTKKATMVKLRNCIRDSSVPGLVLSALHTSAHVPSKWIYGVEIFIVPISRVKTLKHSEISKFLAWSQTAVNGGSRVWEWVCSTPELSPSLASLLLVCFQSALHEWGVVSAKGSIESSWIRCLDPELLLSHQQSRPGSRPCVSLSFLRTRGQTLIMETY